MPLLRPLLWIFALANLASGARPDFAGIWKIRDTNPPEVYFVEQTASQLRIVMFVDNDGASRVLDVKAPIDGKPRPQTVNGAPCVFTAEWRGEALFWETRREPAEGTRQNRRIMKLSADGKTITAERTRVEPGPEETWTETWEKQHPPEDRNHITVFELRDMLTAKHSRVHDRAFLQGAAAAAFNDPAEVERRLLPIAQKKGKLADNARDLLEMLYDRNSQFRKAVAFATGDDRAFMEKLGAYPEMEVERRAYSRVQGGRDADQRVLLPVSAAGYDSRYQLDTGSTISGITVSEVRRLGLKPEALTRSITDVAGVQYDAPLVIVPALSIGEIRLRNVPFWQMGDRQLAAPGMIGIDILLKLETVRWNSDSVIEIGFPPEERDMRRANLYFEGDYPVVRGGSGQQDGLTFYLDTGYAGTHFYIPFAARFLDLVALNGRQSIYEMNGEAGSARIKDLVVADLPFEIGGMKMQLHDLPVLLEHAPDTDAWQHGRIGIDILNQAARITLDFHAMRLTLE